MINDIVTKFSFIGSLKPQETFNENLQGSIKLLTGMAAAIEVTAAGMFWWASSVNSSLQPLVDLQNGTNVAVSAMQELGYAASQNGSDLNAVTNSISSLHDKVQEFAQFGTGDAAEAAAYLGVSFRDASGQVKKADVIFDDVRRSMQGLSDVERIKIMDKLGIDRSLLQTMKLTSDEMESLRSRAHALGVVTAEDAEEVGKFNTAMGDMKFAMQGVQQMVAISFAPMMGNLVEGFVDLLTANRDWIVGGLQWLGEVVTSAAGFLHRMWPVLLGLAAAFVVLKVATFGWGAALAIVFSPIVLITAAVIAVLLIIDDLIVAMQGGQSIIADFFKEFFGVDIVPIIQGLIDAFIWLFEEIKQIFAPLADFFSSIFSFWTSIFSGKWGEALDHLLDAFTALGEVLSNLFEAWFKVFTTVWSAVGGFISDIFTSAFEGIKNIWADVVDWLKQKALDILPDWAVKLISGGADVASAAIGYAGDAASYVGDAASYVGDKASAAWDSVTGWLGYAGDASAAWDSVTGWLGGKDNTANDMLDRSTGGAVTSNSVEQEVQMNIYTSDAQAAGQAAADSLNEQLKDAQMLAQRGGW